MEFPFGYERRERPSRAAAPTKNMKDPDSEDDDQPIRPQKSSSAGVIRTDNDNPSVGFSPDSITVISAQSSAPSITTLNRPSSPKKRSNPEADSDSPTKKSRKIVIKAKKSNQAVIPGLSQAGTTPQPASGSIPEIEAMRKCLMSLESRINQDAADRDEAQKKITLIEQKLQDAQAAKTDEKDLTHPADDQDLRKENKDLLKGNQKLKILMAEQNHFIATLKQDRITPSGFKLMDCDVEQGWKGIAFEISNFVFQVLTKKPYGDQAPPGANLKDVEALKKQQKKNIHAAPFQFQRYIWLHLVTDIFQAGKATWGGPTGNAFHRYCLDISEIDFDGMTQLSTFKSSQAELLSKSFDDHNREEAKNIAREMALTLEIFMDPDEMRERASPKKRLWHIVRKAVELNDKFLRSRAFYLTN
ncbi:hypothetical protein FVEN_g10497 [Fusarium venenatum]|nr:hypothetical protein FVEN_g10497 [Fusarium venenatum]